MILRLAKINDCRLYFDWFNDSTVRQNAFTENKVDWQAHKQWFKDKLDSHNSYLYIAQEGDIDIGQVRFDCANKKATVDYSIDSRYRNLGFGKMMLEMALDNFARAKTDIEVIVAQVKEENVASSIIFTKLNFTKSSEEDRVITYTLSL